MEPGEVSASTGDLASLIDQAVGGLPVGVEYSKLFVVTDVSYIVTPIANN